MVGSCKLIKENFMNAIRFHKHHGCLQAKGLHQIQSTRDLMVDSSKLIKLKPQNRKRFSEHRASSQSKGLPYRDDIVG
jgi:hypothetical protein